MGGVASSSESEFGRNHTKASRGGDGGQQASRQDRDLGAAFGLTFRQMRGRELGLFRGLGGFGNALGFAVDVRHC
jgi:hypothetical protein